MASRSARPPTIGDVAARAGVSPATVSRVMNGNTSVDQLLAERVRSAATDLHYSASPLARSLVLGKTNTVAVVVPDLENPTFQGVLRGLSRAAGHDAYHVLVADSAESIAEERILAVETRRRCDGIVLCSPRMPDEELHALLTELQPVVLVNRAAGTTGTPTVAADHQSGLAGLLLLLHEEGHRSLVFLSGPPRSASNVARMAAVHAFVRDHPDTRLEVLPGGVSFSDGYDGADAVLASGATGVLAFNDLVAMGLMSALGERGVRIPEQLSVTGFDDIPFARYTTPALTTAAVPASELGEQAWLRMRDLLDHRRPARPLVFRPTIERRGSTGTPPSPEKPNAETRTPETPHTRDPEQRRRRTGRPSGE